MRIHNDDENGYCDKAGVSIQPGQDNHAHDTPQRNHSDGHVEQVTPCCCWAPQLLWRTNITVGVGCRHQVESQQDGYDIPVGPTGPERYHGKSRNTEAQRNKSSHNRSLHQRKCSLICVLFSSPQILWEKVRHQHAVAHQNIFLLFAVPSLSVDMDCYDHDHI